MKANELIHFGDKLIIHASYYHGPAMIVQIGKNKFMVIETTSGNRLKDKILKSKHPITTDSCNLYGFFSKSDIIKYLIGTSGNVHITVKKRHLYPYCYKEAAKCWGK
jgi:hypothetical protein